MYWSIDKILSYNALLNFILGGRGCGKSFGTKKYCLNRFLKTGEEFVILRRYKSELKECKEKFFKDLIKEGLYKDHKLTVSGNTFYCDDKVCGYAIALSTSSMLKSSSYPNVKNIIFDEVIIDKSLVRYLPNEVHAFLDIIETVGRTRDIRVFLLSNAISMNNPYFIYFDLLPPYNNNFRTFKNGLIVIEYVKDEEYTKFKKDTPFGKLIDGTSYGDYAINNIWLKDSNSFIEKKSNNCRFMFSIIINNVKLGLWFNTNNNLCYISNDIDPSNNEVYSLDNDSHNENNVLIKNKSDIRIKYIINKYRRSELRFENQKIKNSIIDFINKFIG